MTFAVLRVPALAYMLVRREIAKLPMSDYGHMIDPAAFGRPERLKFDMITLQAYPTARPNVIYGSDPDAGEHKREELARILELVAKDGLDGPRDLDVALDAILTIFGEEQ